MDYRLIGHTILGRESMQKSAMSEERKSVQISQILATNCYHHTDQGQIIRLSLHECH